MDGWFKQAQDFYPEDCCLCQVRKQKSMVSDFNLLRLLSIVT